VAQVVLENVYKSFPNRQSGAGAIEADNGAIAILRRINLSIADGEFMVLVGPSGCGKSTLLRLIAGLETLTGGNIAVGDRQVNDLPPKERDIAMVFQSYALYPHMTVYDNLAFGLRRGHQSAGHQSAGVVNRAIAQVSQALPRRWRYETVDERAIAQRVQTIAEMLQIETLLDRLPKQLSGGQKQRVALGRAMARDPQVFLMDEPLSNLDAKLRTETRTQIVNLQRKLGTTTIYVTHDQTEAMTMGDRIAVMNAGQIQQIARPLELYNQPANRFVAEFIGSPPMNFLPVQVKASATLQHPQFRLTLPGIWEMDLKHYVDRPVLLGIRPEHFHVSVPAPKNIPIRVEHVEALGSETYVTASLTEAKENPEVSPLIQVRVEPDRSVSPGETLWLSVPPEKIHLFDAETEEAIASPLGRAR
jgi:multiple sugar transport system ATP-binding protein